MSNSIMSRISFNQQGKNELKKKMKSNVQANEPENWDHYSKIKANNTTLRVVDPNPKKKGDDHKDDKVSFIVVWKNSVLKKYRSYLDEMKEIYVENLKIEGLDEFLGNITTNLRKLSFISCSLMDSILTFTSKYQGLTYLNLQNNLLQSIPDLKIGVLRQLLLEGNKISLINLDSIRGYKNLKVLDLSKNQILFEDGKHIYQFVVALKELPSFEHLLIKDNALINKYYRDFEEVIVTKFANSQIKMVNGKSITKQWLDIIKEKKLPALEELVPNKTNEEEKEDSDEENVEVEENEITENKLSIVNKLLQDAINEPSKSLDKFAYIELYLNKMKMAIYRDPDLIAHFFDLEENGLRDEINDFIDNVSLLVQSQNHIIRNIINMLSIFCLISQERFGKECFKMLENLCKSSKSWTRLIAECLYESVVKGLLTVSADNPHIHIIEGLRTLMENNQIKGLWGEKLDKVGGKEKKPSISTEIIFIFKKWLKFILKNIAEDTLELKLAQELMLVIENVSSIATGCNELADALLELVDHIFKDNTITKRYYTLLEHSVNILVQLCKSGDQSVPYKVYNNKNAMEQFIDYLTDNLNKIVSNLINSISPDIELIRIFCLLIELISIVMVKESSQKDLNSPLFCKQVGDKKSIFKNLIQLSIKPKIDCRLIYTVFKCCYKFCKHECIVIGDDFEGQGHARVIIAISQWLGNLKPILKILEGINSKQDKTEDDPDVKPLIISCVNLIKFFSQLKDSPMGKTTGDLYNLADELSTSLNEGGRDAILFGLLKEKDDDDIMICVAKCLQALDVKQLENDEIRALINLVIQKKNVSAGRVEIFISMLLLVLAKKIQSEGDKGNFIENFGDTILIDIFEILKKTLHRDLRDDPEEEDEKLSLAAACIYFLRHLDKKGFDHKFQTNVVAEYCKSSLKAEILYKKYTRLDIETEILPFSKKINHIVNVLEVLDANHNVTFRVFHHVSRLMLKDVGEKEKTYKLDAVNPIGKLWSNIEESVFKKQQSEILSFDEQLSVSNSLKEPDENYLKEFMASDGLNKMLLVLKRSKNLLGENLDFNSLCPWLTLIFGKNMLSKLCRDSINDVKKCLANVKEETSIVAKQEDLKQFSFIELLAKKKEKYSKNPVANPGMILHPQSALLKNKKTNVQDLVTDKPQLAQTQKEVRRLVISALLRCILIAFTGGFKDEDESTRLPDSIVKIIIFDTTNFKTLVSCCDEIGWIEGNIGIKFLQILVYSVSKSSFKDKELKYIIDMFDFFVKIIERILHPLRVTDSKMFNQTNLWRLISCISKTISVLTQVLKRKFAFADIVQIIQQEDPKFSIPKEKDSIEKVFRNKIILSKILNCLIPNSIIQTLMDYMIESWRIDSKLTKLYSSLNSDEPMESLSKSLDSAIYVCQVAGWKDFLYTLAVIITEQYNKFEVYTRYFFILEKQEISEHFHLKGPYLKHLGEMVTLFKIKLLLFTKEMKKKIDKKKKKLEEKPTANEKKMKRNSKETQALKEENEQKDDKEDKEGKEKNEKKLEDKAINNKKEGEIKKNTKKTKKETNNNYQACFYGKIFYSQIPQLQQGWLIYLCIDYKKITKMHFFQLSEKDPCKDCFPENLCPEGPTSRLMDIPIVQCQIITNLNFVNRILIEFPKKENQATSSILVIDLKFSLNAGEICTFLKNVDKDKDIPRPFVKNPKEIQLERFFLIQMIKPPLIGRSFTNKDPYFSGSFIICEIKIDQIIFNDDVPQFASSITSLQSSKIYPNIILKDIISVIQIQGNYPVLEIKTKSFVYNILFGDEFERLRFRKKLLEVDVYLDKQISINIETHKKLQ